MKTVSFHNSTSVYGSVNKAFTCHARFEVLIAVKLSLMVFWVVALGKLLGCYRFRGMFVTTYKTAFCHNLKDHI